MTAAASRGTELTWPAPEAKAQTQTAGAGKLRAEPRRSALDRLARGAPLSRTLRLGGRRRVLPMAASTRLRVRGGVGAASPCRGAKRRPRAASASTPTTASRRGAGGTRRGFRRRTAGCPRATSLATTTEAGRRSLAAAGTTAVESCHAAVAAAPAAWSGDMSSGTPSADARRAGAGAAAGGTGGAKSCREDIRRDDDAPALRCSAECSILIEVH